MTVPNRSIGQDPQSQLLWQISKQLDQLIKIMGTFIPITTTTTTAVPVTTTTTTIVPTTTTTTTVAPTTTTTTTI
jgi:hypothetical protein